MRPLLLFFTTVPVFSIIYGKHHLINLFNVEIFHSLRMLLRETFQILSRITRIAAKCHKEKRFRENHLEPILVFVLVLRNTQNLVWLDSSSSFKNPTSYPNGSTKWFWFSRETFLERIWNWNVSRRIQIPTKHTLGFWVCLRWTLVHICLG